MRVQCVLCRSKKLEPFYTITDFPLTASSTTANSSFDVFNDLVFNVCGDCRCVQLITLVDPIILYAHDNKAALTPTWVRHHTAFAEFVSTDPTIDGICEVGGGSNPLVSFFPRALKYSVLDIYETQHKVGAVSYTVGNCETYVNYDEDTVLLSHTFEHLYDPHAFLESVRASRVKNVFVSVPNFTKWLSDSLTVSILNNEHTFYFEQADIEALLSQYGFATKRSAQFGDHSLFFHFQRGTTSFLPIQPSNAEEAIFYHFHNKSSRIVAFSMDKPFYIMPSFYAGQVIYHYIKKDLVLGFLDNDRAKIGKRLYGTNLLTYSPLHLVTSEHKDVLLIRTPYFEEMKEQLTAIHPSISVHVLDI